MNSLNEYKMPHTIHGGTKNGSNELYLKTRDSYRAGNVGFNCTGTFLKTRDVGDLL